MIHCYIALNPSSKDMFVCLSISLFSKGHILLLYCAMVMTENIQTKYTVAVKQLEKSIKMTDEAKAELHSIGMMDDKGKLKLKGVSPKMLKKMKLEAVECPVLKKDVGFIQCYVCKNFNSRITGQVYCKGDPL
jgi:hypothetical protein